MDFAIAVHILRALQIGASEQLHASLLQNESYLKDTGCNYLSVY